MNLEVANAYARDFTLRDSRFHSRSHLWSLQISRLMNFPNNKFYEQGISHYQVTTRKS